MSPTTPSKEPHTYTHSTAFECIPAVILSVYRALVSVCWALLSVYRALLSVCRALLSVYLR